MARVELSWLIRIGFLFVAAVTVPAPQSTAINKRNRCLRYRASHGRLRFIGESLRYKLRNNCRFQVSLSVEGHQGLQPGLKALYPWSNTPIKVFRRLNWPAGLENYPGAADLWVA